MSNAPKLETSHEINNWIANPLFAFLRSTGTIFADAQSGLDRSIQTLVDHPGRLLPEVQHLWQLATKENGVAGAIAAVDAEIAEAEAEKLALLRRSDVVGDDLVSRLAAIAKRIATLRARRVDLLHGAGEYNRALESAATAARLSLQHLATEARGKIIEETRQAMAKLEQEIVELIGDRADRLAVLSVIAEQCRGPQPFNAAIERILRGEAAPIASVRIE